MKVLIRLFYTFMLVFSFLITVTGQQKYRLAVEYYNSGEYEKAAQIYESLYKENPNNKSYFNWYIQCLIDLRDYENAGKITQAEIKKNPNDGSLYVTDRKSTRLNSSH